MGSKSPIVKRLEALYPGGKWVYNPVTREWKNETQGVIVTKKPNTKSTFIVSPANDPGFEIEL